MPRAWNSNLHISGIINDEKVDIETQKVDIQRKKADIGECEVDIEAVQKSWIFEDGGRGK